jgi:hypothetical protein
VAKAGRRSEVELIAGELIALDTNTRIADIAVRVITD